MSEKRTARARSQDGIAAAKRAPRKDGEAAMAGPGQELAPARIVIENVTPQIDCGRFPVKRVVGDEVTVEVDLVCDGHDIVAGVLCYRRTPGEPWAERDLEIVVNDRYRASFVVTELGRWEYTVEAWVDAFASWRRGFARKVEAEQDVTVDLLVGAELVRAAGERAPEQDRDYLRGVGERVQRGSGAISSRISLILDEKLSEVMRRYPDRTRASRYGRVLHVAVDRRKAEFGAWYELFPRSTGSPSAGHGTFRTAENVLPYIADMGFDIVYLPPIHPIGRTFRKGKNNALTSTPEDPGSPWAIGAQEGGHKAVHPELGSLADFRHFVAAAEKLGLEVAIDIALQVSPDHPYVREHPEWFLKRPDGSIQYAENPPKKYQDIYPLDFGCDNWRALWAELLSIFSFWIEQGIRIFRVDNPHTKSLPFWQWCIAELRAQHPDVILLSEAFTRPKLMYALAKLGFHQSYTYFTWRNTRWEFTDYLTELTQTEVAEYFRPNFWPNTPDILPEHLQFGGRPAFLVRLALAATLCSNYGVYGPAFELMEHVARPGSEEYIDNEKYELRPWDLDRADSLRPFITRINQIRRANRALQDNRSLRFHPTDNEHLLAYSKHHGDNIILVAANLDYYHRQSGWVNLDLAALGLAEGQRFQIHDLISDAHYEWLGAHNYIELDPGVMPVHIFRIRRHVRTEADFDYFA